MHQSMPSRKARLLDPTQGCRSARPLFVQWVHRRGAVLHGLEKAFGGLRRAHWRKARYVDAQRSAVQLRRQLPPITHPVQPTIGDPQQDEPQAR